MKKVIIYTSKTGTTKKCALKIYESIKDVEIKDLEKTVINIDNYDLIIIGTPIRMGMINKKIKSFIINNIKFLKEKKLAFFLCCGFPDNVEQYYLQNFSNELVKKSIIHTTFGGEMDIDRQKGFDKIIAKMVSKDSKNKKPELIEDNILKFTKIINENDNK